MQGRDLIPALFFGEEVFIGLSLGLTLPSKLLILASVFDPAPRFVFQKARTVMKKLLPFVLSCGFVAISVCASAGVAPAAPNSALVQSGAKIAPPAKQATQDQDK